MPCEAPFDSEEWRFSVDWDAIRALLFVTPDGAVRLQGERLQDLTSQLPEVAAVTTALPAKAVVLDGVVAVLDPEGRPDLVAITERLCGGPRVAPAVFLATDLLHLDSTPTLAWPFQRRLEALGKLVKPATYLQVPDWVATEGHAFFDAAEDRGLSAVLARRIEARYHAGVASPDRLRIPIEDRATAVVVAVEDDVRGGHLRLHLAERVDGRWVPAGRVEAAFSPVVDAWLRAQVRGLQTPQPPFDAVALALAGMFPPPARGTRLTWVRPHLTVSVRHGGRASDGTLRFPVAVALREDVEPATCVRRAPVPPPQDQPPRPGGFRPTVLATLPFTESRPPGTD
jgi:bifunctional non-homologous end joining protein LigD